MAYQIMLTSTPIQTQSFFVTHNFAAAWRVYCQWSDFQTTIGCVGEVELAGCRVNQQNCWEVLITQHLYDRQLAELHDSSF